jgi:hypothetical protein
MTRPSNNKRIHLRGTLSGTDAGMMQEDKGGCTCGDKDGNYDDSFDDTCGDDDGSGDN